LGERTITVESRVFAGAHDGEPLPSVRFAVDGPLVTPRELIAKAVARQLEALARRRQSASQIMARHYLTQTEIEAQAAEGRVGLPESAERRPDLEREIARAWVGYEQGAFRIVVQGEMLGRLDQPCEMPPDGRVTFLRLTPLKGG